MIFGISALLMIYGLYRSELRSPVQVIAGMLLLLVNPYVLGLGLHVFTDMLALLLVVMAVTALRKRRTIFLFISVSLALLTRQYAVFMVVAAGVFLLFPGQGADGKRKSLFTALFLGVIPITILMVLWMGPAPPAGIERWIIPDGSLYRVRYVYIYTAFMTLYSLPLVACAWRRLVSLRTVVPGLIISSGALLFPLRASATTVAQTDVNTVGIAHGLMVRTLGHGLPLNVFYWALSCAGFITLTALVETDLVRSRGRTGSFAAFLSIMVIAFLAIMPFSYQVWEKYLIMILPFFNLRLLMMFGEGDGESTLKGLRSERTTNEG